MRLEPGYKECPFCAERIRERATYCRFCRRMLPVGPPTGERAPKPVAEQTVQRTGMADLTQLAPEGLRDLLLDSSAGAAEAERRVLTIMFADLCGYTELAEDRDPEYVRELISRCFEQMAAAVDRYGGTVVHFLGDAILAAFGAPRAHEDDPERSVRAALEMIEGVKKVGRRERLSLGLSVGIHIGEVVIGGISVGDRVDFTAFGDAVNTAARLQDLAGFAEILISERVYQQVRYAFECESRPPAFVKHKQKPIINYKVLSPTGKSLHRAPHGHGRLTTLIGRQKELALIEQAAEALAKGKSAFVCIAGEQGVGKTRLAWEVKQRLVENAPLWLEAGCVSFGSSIPYGPVLDLLRAALAIEDSDSTASIREKIEKGTRGIEGATREMRAALAYLLGDSSSDNPLSHLLPKQRKEALIAKSIGFLKGLSSKQPVVVMADDLHWADSLSLQWMDRLVEELNDHPVFVLCVYRPSLKHSWPKAHPPALIELEELSDRESRRLLYELLEVSALPAHLAEQILLRTRGNPFFVEELIYALVDCGVLARRGKRWEFVREFEAAEIPDTLRSVILSRVDVLEARLRHVLQCAAVIGHSFRYEILDYVMEFQARLRKYVCQLVDAHFLIEQSHLLEWLYLFRHVLTHDVIYETLLKRRRAEFHRKIGGCIESLYSDQLERHYEFLAHHFYLSDDSQKAAYYLEKAAEKLERLYANEALVETLHRLIEVLDKRLSRTSESARMRAEALIRLGRVHYYLGEYKSSYSAYQRAVQVADRLSGGDHLAATARRNLAEVDRILGQHDQALRRLEVAERIWARLGDDANRLTVYNSKGVVRMSQGRYGEAVECFRQGASLARHNGTRDALANVLNDLGIACLHAGRYEEALQTFGEALGLMEELGDKRGMAATLNNLGMCHERLGQYAQAQGYYGRSFELAQKIGHRYALLASLINLGQCYQYQGQYHAAIRQFRRVVQLTDVHPNPYAASLAHGNWAANLVCLGRCAEAPERIRNARRLAVESRNHLAAVNADLAEVLYLTSRKRYTKAERLARKTIADIEKHGYHDYQSLAYCYLAEALLGRKCLSAAQRTAKRSLRLADQTGNPRDRAWAMWTCAEVQMLSGRDSSAQSWVEEAKRIAATIGDNGLVRRIEAAG